MDSVVIVALITAGTTLLGAGITGVAGLALIRHRLTSVEKKLDEHNGYAKMYAEAHEDIAIMRVDIQYLKESMSDLRERSKAS